MNAELWHGYAAHRFSFEGRSAIVVFPKKAAAGSPWALKTEYWDAFPEVELSLLERGYHVAFVQNKNRWATEEECHAKARFVRHVTQTFGLSERCIPIGMSCGGAYAVKFGGMYPELIRCMFIDAPVLNFCSIPGQYGNSFYESLWEKEFSLAYPGIKRHQLPGANIHPICYAPTLLAHKIPIVLVYGTEDRSVIYEENGRLLKEAYEGTGLLKTIAVNARGHHPHGMIGDNSIIIDFILANT